eukprot:scaffold21703_cov67-Cyclotella_meneghiniana.AAC.2
MSTPVTTDTWAGNFDCSVCRRKRLVGSEFSKKALERHRKTGGILKCKQCTSAQESSERLAAASKAASNNIKASEDPITCTSCKQSLSTAKFNRSQLSKRDNVRCRICVEESIQDEEQSRKASKQNEIEELKRKIKEADAKGNVKEKLKYESQLSALEAEHVTGLKPVVMGRGRGRRSSWRGRGTGRGRGK